MTTISEKLKQIKSAKNSIKAAIIAKGGSFDGISSFADYSKAIEAIPESRTKVKVSITISCPDPFSAKRYQYSHNGSSAPSSSLIVNGKQLLDDTVHDARQPHTFTTEVPANSTVSWSAAPFYFMDYTDYKKYDTIRSWKISTTGTDDTQGSFTVSDGDYGIVLTASSASIGFS